MRAIRRVSIAYRNAMGRLNGWRETVAQRLHDYLLKRMTSGRPPIGLPVTLAVVFAASVWAGSGTSAADPAGCFHYGQVVTLSGRYFSKVAPVDDGVIRDPLNVAERRVTLLKLAASFCVNADSISRGVPPASTIQLNCPGVHPADGTELSIKGRLLGAHTENGHPPVLLMCR